MIKTILKFAIGMVGAFSAFAAIREFFPNGIVGDGRINWTVSVAISVAAFFIFFIISAIVIGNLSKIVDKLEITLKERNYSSYEFVLGCTGFIIGLIIANLLCIPILRISFWGIPTAIIINMLMAYSGYSLALRFKNDKLLNRIRKRYEEETRESSNAKLLDTSSIIDGRIFDILFSGFLEGKLIIKQFVIDELGALADSDDTFKRAKGRKGLDLISNMQKDFSGQIVIEESGKSNLKGTDELLLEEASGSDIAIITNDFNLNKIAVIKNIKVLNINELANAMKPLANVGDEINVMIAKQGKERQQGIGYLESGTMVVVENAKNKVGETVTAIVTSVIQTQAGRMIFANHV